MNSIYNEYFFNEFYEYNGGGNYMNREQWGVFFNRIAEKIIERYNPRTMLDAGCATGYLVEAMRDRGVECYGIDISEYAIRHVREDIKPYCKIHSITEKLPEDFPDRFDLIITLEVLEHLYPEEGEKAIRNLCSYTDTIIFSSTPFDIEDRTHVNVQLLEYWSRIFAKQSFYRDLISNFDFICPWAVSFTKQESLDKIIYEYELNMRINSIEDSNKVNLYNSQIDVEVFYEFGFGFLQENSFCKKVTVSNNKSNYIEFDMSGIDGDIKNLRIDPMSIKGIIQINNIKILSKENEVIEMLRREYSCNAKYIDINQVFYFDTDDSQIVFNVDDISIKKVILDIGFIVGTKKDIPFMNKLIEFNIIKDNKIKKERLFNQEEIDYCNQKLKAIQEDFIEAQANIVNLENKIQNDAAEISTTKEELNKNQNELYSTREELNKNQNELYSTREELNKNQNELYSTREELHYIQHRYDEIQKRENELENTLKLVKDELVDTKNQLEFFILHHHNALQQVEELKIENQKNYSMYESIADSKIWKFTKPIRVTLDIIKKPFRKYEKKSEESLIYTLEEIEYKNNTLKLQGWLFHKTEEVDEFIVVLKANNNEYSFNINYGIIREDVATVFGKEHLMSGFNTRVLIEPIIGFKVYLYIRTKNYEKNILIKDIKVNRRKIVCNIISRINKQNIYKGMWCLKNKDISTIIKGLTKPQSIYLDQDYVADIDLNRWIKNNIVEELSIPKDIYKYTIDIIIPIYNGYEFFDKLFSSIEKTQMKYRLILIDDKSTDKRVGSYLRQYADEHANVILMENKVNLGFVKSVNRAISICENNIALINSDVEVPELWLERLMLPILKDTHVATSTPFTTCGTICSFPNFGQDNEIFCDFDVQYIDNEFKKIKPRYTEMPTGVGFCMGMNLKVVEEIGILDDKTFEKGYGEENDWCQRCIIAGYKNVMVENLFVYHKHGGSFLNEEKVRLIKENGDKLNRKHPNYLIDVAKYCEDDPTKDIRDYLIMKLSSESYDTYPSLIFDHNLGGGATSYLNNLVKEMLGNGKKCIIVRYDINRSSYRLQYMYQEYDIQYQINDFANLFDILKFIPIKHIYINELVTYPKLYETLDSIIKINKKLNSELTLFLHDFFLVCPTINLLDNQEKYCEIPGINKCEKCIRANRFATYHEFESMEKWRSTWNNVIKECKEVRVFSYNSKEILEKAYGELNNVEVVPHQVNYLRAIKKNHKTTKTLNIGLLGILNYHKGKEIVKEMLKVVEEKNLDINFIMVGISEDKVVSNHFNEVGRYKPEDLPNIVYKNDIDIFFISSICPETFSYTTEEVIKLNMPLAVFNLGAPAERAKNYDKALIIDQIDANFALNEIRRYCENRLLNIEEKHTDRKVLFVVEYISFSSRYRAEHFMEQLLINGIESDLIELKDIKNVDLKLYKAIVIYRCTYSDAIFEFIDNAKKNELKIFYDIDDYIFNYDDIDYLDFLKKEEYKNFRSITDKTYKCMQLCHGFLTSTENMKKAILKNFPDKAVMVNRNVASNKMVNISLKAKNSYFRDASKVILGYFSGSRTHDGDFEVIKGVLLDIMQRYENVYLKIGGVIELPDEFKRVSNRIMRFDFVDWTKLPELIASVNINLMPLESTFFHECKSENKWTEAALVGVPTVASRNSELEIVIKNGEDGFLCSSSEEWLNNLETLILDSSLRNKMGEKAHERVINNYITSETGKNAIDFILNDI